MKLYWRELLTFVFLTYAIGGIFEYLVIDAGDLHAGGNLYGLGGMWSPGIAAFLVVLLYKRKLRSFGWRWGKTKYQLASFFIPFGYVLAVHILVWTTGIGGIVDKPAGEIILSTLQRIGMHIVFACIFALGEEIGWSGYFVPRLAEHNSFTRVALIRGLVWSIWHYPMIIGGVYGPDTLPVWYKLLFFTITTTTVSFAYAWLRLKSGSLFTGMFFHASHNMFFQGMFQRISVDSGSMVYYVNEFGIFSAVMTILVAVYFWTRRREVEPRPGQVTSPVET